jgi:hypothetical protein
MVQLDVLSSLHDHNVMQLFGRCCSTYILFMYYTHIEMSKRKPVLFCNNFIKSVFHPNIAGATSNVTEKFCS